MEEWNAFVRRTRRRIEYRKRYRHGDISSDDEFYYPPRINWWPFLLGGLAVVAVIAAYYTWSSDGAPATEAAPETTITIPPTAGLTSRDLAGCLSFHTAISDARDLLRRSSEPEGRSLAESGALTEDLIEGYREIAGALVGRFDDEALGELVESLDSDLETIDAEARESEAAGTPGWAEAFPRVDETIREFGSEFDRRCERGGVLVSVAE